MGCLCIALDGAGDEVAKVRNKIMDAVKRQSEQLIVSFLEAAASNNRAVIEEILEAGAIEVDDVDAADRTALHLAAAHGHLALVQRLVTKHGASTIVKDRCGGTAMDDAIRHGHKAVVEFLATQPVSTDLGSDDYIEMCGQLSDCSGKKTPSNDRVILSHAFLMQPTNL
jgi:ankyrin repeat protein